MGSKVEGAIEADSQRLPMHRLVIAVRLHEGFGRRASQLAQPTEVGDDDGRFDPVQQVRAVIPLTGVRCPAAWRKYLPAEKQVQQLLRTQAGEVMNGPDARS
ncbi:MAG: hypothetical protein A3F76_10005 [Burkholderiales bacterium RIFCSPLOWO2_12_FULL_65_40]|nr:MAG: hypothetical protein A3F76_10005 [Burkholderiales bacterium RIFCSPLOWO2_12_FULL_65_40]